MKKFLKGFFKWLVIIIILANIAILVTGNQHIYKAVGLTYLKGHTGPTIDDYKSFENREVKTGTAQPWALSSRYNKTPLSNEDKAYHESLGTAGYLVIKNDSIVHESYWDGYNENSLTNSFSVAKSMVSVLVGCAIGDGLIKDVNDPVVKYLPEFKEVTRDSVTIRHLLTMSSGINFRESYGDPFGMMAKAYYGSDLKELVKQYTVTGTPGKEFYYAGGNTLMLGFLVEKVTGKKLADYTAEKIWQPVGAANTALWTLDGENGDERSYCCFYSNVRDFARLGKLYKDSGRWNGKQLVPESYVLSSITPASDVMDGGQPLQIYGYQWWCINYKPAHGSKLDVVPRYRQLFYARGIKGQYIIVDPAKNTIIVRVGHKRDSKSNGHPMDVTRYIEMAENL